MFERALLTDMQKIFAVKKATLDAFSPEAPEQECLFINVQSSRNSFKDGRVYARVTGTASMFGPNDKLTFGFFSKRIMQAGLADPNLTKPFFFSDMDETSQNIQNIVQRSFSFVYFFNGQYDPDIGTITSIELSEV